MLDPTCGHNCTSGATGGTGNERNRPSGGHISTSPHGSLYEMPSLCIFLYA